LRELATSNEYRTPDAERKEKFLETSKITNKLAAVMQRCSMPLGYDEVTPNPRRADAVVKILKLLHLQAFHLQADWA
jgi:hypothetical protein